MGFFNKETGVIKEVQKEIEADNLEPQIMEIPEAGLVEVRGNPIELGEKLDYTQGDNKYNFKGDCGLVSAANILISAGIDATEDDVIKTAVKNNLCFCSIFDAPEEKGGTNAAQRAMLLKLYGIDTSYSPACEENGSLESIADKIEGGHGVNLSINAGYAWDDPNAIGDGRSNHSIIATGTARDTVTGEIKGFFVCDSGAGYDTGAKFMSAEKMKECYIDVPGASVLYTKEPVRTV